MNQEEEELFMKEEKAKISFERGKIILDEEFFGKKRRNKKFMREEEESETQIFDCLRLFSFPKKEK